MTYKTEEEIERHVERMMDHTDKQFMKDLIPEKQYEQAVRELDAWADEQYARIPEQDS